MTVRAAIFLVSAAVTSIFFIQFCATVFQCGCQAIWSTGAQFCNIHSAHGKHCPWCVYGTTGYSIVYGTMLVAQAAISFWPAAWAWAPRLAMALVAFPTVGAVLAVAMGLMTGYWN
jgi:hypothetical protein